MTILIPTKEKGATTKPTTMVYAEPTQLVTDDMLRQQLPDLGMNTAFFADLLSAMLTHERCGRHLYRSVQGRTNNPMLQAKYHEFGQETERHVEILEQLISQMGGNPNYVSPAARAVEGMDTKLVESTFMLAGSVDLMTAEMAMLDAVFLAESADHANWKALAAVAEQLPSGSMRDAFEAAVGEVEQQEDRHLEWASETKLKLVKLQAGSKTMTQIGANVEQVVAVIKEWLRD